MSGKLPKYIPHVSSMQSSAVFVRKHKAVKLNAKIKDSTVSRIQMWRETRYLCIKKKKNKKIKKILKKGRGRIASWVIENLLEMRPNRPK